MWDAIQFRYIVRHNEGARRERFGIKLRGTVVCVLASILRCVSVKRRFTENDQGSGIRHAHDLAQCFANQMVWDVLENRPCDHHIETVVRKWQRSLLLSNAESLSLRNDEFAADASLPSCDVGEPDQENEPGGARTLAHILPRESTRQAEAAVPGRGTLPTEHYDD
jgi:hypothetical protein